VDVEGEMAQHGYRALDLLKVHQARDLSPFSLGYVDLALWASVDMERAITERCQILWWMQVDWKVDECVQYVVAPEEEGACSLPAAPVPWGQGPPRMHRPGLSCTKLMTCPSCRGLGRSPGGQPWQHFRAWASSLARCTSDKRHLHGRCLFYSPSNC